MNPANVQPHVVIVGGGISGLAAAFFLRDQAVRVTVLEGSPQLGGKLRVSEIAGVAIDEGAEALLVTRPEGTGLIADAGLADQRVTPGTTSAAIWTRGALRPLPRRQYMGVPSDMAELARSGVLSAGGVTRAREDLELPPTPRDGDVPVARVHRGPIRGRGRGPAGRSAAGRGLRGAFFRVVVRRDAAEPGGRVPAAPLARRGGTVPAAAASSRAPGRAGGARIRHPRRRIGIHDARRRPGNAARHRR